MAHEHGHPIPEAEYKKDVSSVMKMIIFLGILTVVEVAFALAWNNMGGPKRPLNIILIVLSLVKAVCIMGVFMHVSHETKGFKYTILIPFTFLIWAIIAFLWEGNCWHNYQSLINFF